MKDCTLTDHHRRYRGKKTSVITETAKNSELERKLGEKEETERKLKDENEKLKRQIKFYKDKLKYDIATTDLGQTAKLEKFKSPKNNKNSANSTSVTNKVSKNTKSEAVAKNIVISLVEDDSQKELSKKKTNSEGNAMTLLEMKKKKSTINFNDASKTKSLVKNAILEAKREAVKE